MAIELDHLVGIPYVPHGRDYDGADCWGIVYLYQRDIAGSPVPSYSAEMAARAFRRRDIAPLIETERDEHWIEVKDDRKAGDVVLMRTGREASHVGVALGRDLMLHSEPGSDGLSEIIRLSDARVRSRIVGYFRRGEPC